MLKILMRKAISLYSMRKALKDDKLAYFKKLMLAHLDKLGNDDEERSLKKAGYPVGTIREWKGKKFVKIAPGKWRAKYDSESRGAKMAVAAIKRKVDAATTVQELLQISLEHRDRFSDAQGHPLPFVQELSAYVSSHGDKIEAGKKARTEKPKTATVEEKPEGGEAVKEKSTENNKNADDAHLVSSDAPENINDFDAIHDKYQSAKAVEGDEDEIAVGKEIVSGKWRLVEADTPTASHDERTFNKTKGFPTTGDGSTINDRDYEKDRAAQEIVIDIGMDYDMRALSFDSPVVVTKDGIVISGNNRTMSSKIAARQGTDAKYIEALKKKAKKFGFTPEDVSKFKHPRVIFETDENEGYSTALFAKFNSDDKKAMNPIEEAVKVSKIIKQETVEAIAIKISNFETLGELYADKKAPREIFDTLISAGVIGKNQLPKYYTEQTGITGDGKNFIETALLGSVLTENNIRGLNREGCKSIRQKLVRAITPLVENKGMDGYSVTKELNSGVDIAMQVALLRDKFRNVSEFTKQGAMFEKLDPLAIEFAKKLEGTQKGFAEFMQTMNCGLKFAAAGEADIFCGGVETREEILERILAMKKSLSDALDFLRHYERGRSKGT